MPNRWKPNVTVAAIIERDNRFLLVEEETADGLRLQLPSGHLDPAESPQQACVREVLEETAFDFEPSAVVGIYLNRFVRTRAAADITYLRLVFCGQIGQHHAGALARKAARAGLANALGAAGDDDDAAVVAEVDLAGIGCGHGEVSWMK